MELRELAERVLRSPEIAHKLVAPEPLTDLSPGAAIAVEPPLRPPGLGLHEIRARAPLPRPHQLGESEAAATLLHAFANHELLAMELMASFLLAHPEAPRPFRLGLGRILQEEILHFQLYLDRLAAHGLAFGARPVNRFLWDCCADAADVADFAARMGLTFEAANLDHALAWGAAFRAVGDEATGAVLDRVYADELGHVRHALHWFRKDLPPEADLFATWRDGLRLPLTPERARGEPFSAEARRAAGFDEGFIAAVRLYAHSKGRPPTVRLFNPDAEAQVAARDPEAVPEGPSAAIAADLDLLPLYRCVRDDVLVVRRAPRPAFLEGLAALGWPLPQIVVAPDPRRLADTELPRRKLSGIDPWGLSPAMDRWLAPLRGAVQGEMPVWTPGLEALYDKGFAAGLLREFLLKNAEDPQLDRPDEAGLAIGERAAAEAEVSRIVDGGRTAVLKAAFGTAGRGARRVSGALSAADQRWLEAALARAPVVVEPWLDRVLDLSFHGDVEADGAVRFAGVTRFFTTAGGRYLGTWAGSWSRGLDPEIARFLQADGRDRRWLERVARAAVAHAGAAAAARGHRGAFGVDALVHRTPAGLRLRPLVELNPRVTMGRLALALAPRVAPAADAVWAVLSRGDLARLGAASFAALPERLPSPVWRDGRLVDGVWFTTDPAQATAFCSALFAGAAVGFAVPGARDRR